MRTRLVFVALVLTVAMVLPPSVQRAYACSCLARSLEDKVARADVVATGQVITVQKGDEFRDVTFSIDEVFKGRPSETLTVRDVGTCSMFGSNVETLINGPIFLLFFWQETDGSYTTGICTGSTHLFDEQTLQQIRSISGPAQTELAQALPKTGGDRSSQSPYGETASPALIALGLALLAGGASLGRHARR